MTMKTISKLTALLICLAMVFTFAGCGKESTDTKDTSDDYTVTHTAEITVKDKGTIKLELYGNLAPKTVKNFKELADSGFYNGLTFHRIISGFMIQGGDPNGDGTGDSGKTITGEFTANGFVNNLSHTRGVISMARSSDPDSASSQFFIMHQTATSLDGQYAAFGKVTSGMDIVDDIAKNTPVTDDNGTVLKENQPVIESITVKEK